MVSVPRYNAPPRRNAFGDDDLLDFDPYAVDIVDSATRGRKDFERDPSARWVMLGCHPKMMVRPEFVAEVGRGAHRIVTNDPHWRGTQADDLLIVHLPFTTRARFQRKIAAIRERFATCGERFAPGDAWHWRRWIALDEAGDTDAEFDRQVLGGDDVARLRLQGVLTTPNEVFARAPASCR